MTSPFEGFSTKSVSSQKTYSVSLACKMVGVSPRQLYYWENLGIVRPEYAEFGSYSYRRYSQADVDLLTKIKALIDKGYTLRASAQKVTGKKFNGCNGGANGGMLR